jgi:hypothetical protein
LGVEVRSGMEGGERRWETKRKERRWGNEGEREEWEEGEGVVC